MPGSGWSDALASGTRQVDAANEGLFFLLDRLFSPGVECKRRDGWCPHDGCGKVSAMLRFVERNFATQDRLMAESGYPAQDDHRRAHANLLAGLRALYDSHACGDWEEEAMRAQVIAWAREHVADHDRPLGQWLAQGGAPLPSADVVPMTPRTPSPSAARRHRRREIG